MTTLLFAWNADVFALLAAVLAVGGYLSQRRVSRRSWLFFAAVALFLVALVSPIGTLASGYLFSAHMTQHLLLLLCVPPLALLGLGVTAPPRSWTPRSAFLPWLAGVAAMWVWHAPTLCNAASSSVWVQRAQTASLLVMGAAFWWPILVSKMEAFGATIYLFSACVACTVLGILVTFSSVSVCSAYAHPVDALGVMPMLRSAGLTPENDQQVGGLMMWVPACMIYSGAILSILARYYREEDSAEGVSEHG